MELSILSYLSHDIYQTRHTGVAVAALIEEVLEEFAIQKEDLFCIVSDGASNVRNACRELETSK